MVLTQWKRLSQSPFHFLNVISVSFQWQILYRNPQSSCCCRGYWLDRNLDKSKCGTHLSMHTSDGKETILNMFSRGKKSCFVCALTDNYIWFVSLCKHQGEFFLSVKPVLKLFKMKIRSRRLQLARLLQ